MRGGGREEKVQLAGGKPTCEEKGRRVTAKMSINLVISHTRALEMLRPDQQRTLNKPPTELRCRSFVLQAPRLSAQIGAKTRKNVCGNVSRILTELPILRTTVAGWG